MVVEDQLIEEVGAEASASTQDVFWRFFFRINLFWSPQLNVYIPDMVCSCPKKQLLVQILMVYTWKLNSSSILSV